MHLNKLFFLSLLLGNASWYKNVSYDQVEVIGNVNMVDINESATLKMELSKIHPWAYLYVKIYKNNFLIEERKVLSIAFKNEIYNLDSITKYNCIDNYKIIINYYNNSQIDTIINFSNYSPTTKECYFKGNSINISSSIPTKISFKAKGNNCQTNNYNDNYLFKGIENYSLNNSRFCDFSNFSLSIIQASNQIELNEVEIRLFEKFENSDLPFNGLYTSLYFETTMENNIISLSNNFEYYLNKKDGSIQKEYDDNCYEEALPFFFPLDIGYNKEIKYEIEFSNINSSQEKYIIRGNIVLGDKLYTLFPEDFMKEKYHYILIDDNLKGVNYTYA